MAQQDTQTTYLAKQIRDQVKYYSLLNSFFIESCQFFIQLLQIAKQKLLETAKILCNVLEEPVTCIRNCDIMRGNEIK